MGSYSKWLTITREGMHRSWSYPRQTTAEDLESWADAQQARVKEASDLRDLLREAAEILRERE